MIEGRKPNGGALRKINRADFNAALQDWPLLSNEFAWIQGSLPAGALDQLRVYINSIIYDYYEFHNIIASPVDDLTDRQFFLNRLAMEMKVYMGQTQAVIYEFWKNLADDQYFQNTEDETYTRHVDTVGNVVEDSKTTSRSSDTPQNTFGTVNLDNLNISSASKTEGEADTDSVGTQDVDWHRNQKKSTLGDITVQFRNFAEWESIYEGILKAVAPCFITSGRIS